MVAQPNSGINIGINSVSLDSKPGPNDPVFGRMKYEWYTEVFSPSEVEWLVRSGYSFTAALTGSQRDKRYFLSCQHVCLDFDTDDERSLAANVAAMDIVWRYGSFIYTTMSHTEETPRCRVFFCLSEPLTEPSLYEECLAGMLGHFPYADQTVGDATRLYYGSKGCVITPLRGEMELPVDTFLRYGTEYRQRRDAEAQARALMARANAQRYGNNGDPVTYRGRIGALLVQDVLTAPKGQRNNTYHRKGVKARERLPHDEFLLVLEDMHNAAIANDMPEAEARKTKRQILKGAQL